MLFSFQFMTYNDVNIWRIENEVNDFSVLHVCLPIDSSLSEDLTRYVRFGEIMENEINNKIFDKNSKLIDYGVVTTCSAYRSKLVVSCELLSEDIPTVLKFIVNTIKNFKVINLDMFGEQRFLDQNIVARKTLSNLLFSNSTGLTFSRNCEVVLGSNLALSEISHIVGKIVNMVPDIKTAMGGNGVKIYKNQGFQLIYTEEFNQINLLCGVKVDIPYHEIRIMAKYIELEINRKLRDKLGFIYGSLVEAEPNIVIINTQLSKEHAARSIVELKKIFKLLTYGLSSIVINELARIIDTEDRLRNEGLTEKVDTLLYSIINKQPINIEYISGNDYICSNSLLYDLKECRFPNNYQYKFVLSGDVTDLEEDLRKVVNENG